MPQDNMLNTTVWLVDSKRLMVSATRQDDVSVEVWGKGWGELLASLRISYECAESLAKLLNELVEAKRGIEAQAEVVIEHWKRNVEEDAERHAINEMWEGVIEAETRDAS